MRYLSMRCTVFLGLLAAATAGPATARAEGGAEEAPAAEGSDHCSGDGFCHYRYYGYGYGYGYDNAYWNDKRDYYTTESSADADESLPAEAADSIALADDDETATDNDHPRYEYEYDYHCYGYDYLHGCDPPYRYDYGYGYGYEPYGHEAEVGLDLDLDETQAREFEAEVATLRPLPEYQGYSLAYPYEEYAYEDPVESDVAVLDYYKEYAFSYYNRYGYLEDLAEEGYRDRFRPGIAREDSLQSWMGFRSGVSRGLETGGWLPGHVLLHSDEALIRRMARLYEEPLEERQAALQQHLESIGTVALDVADRFEGQSPMAAEDLTEDLPALGAFLAVIRFVEQGEMAAGDAAEALAGCVSRLSTVWVREIQRIANEEIDAPSHRELPAATASDAPAHTAGRTLVHVIRSMGARSLDAAAAALLDLSRQIAPYETDVRPHGGDAEAAVSLRGAEGPR